MEVIGHQEPGGEAPAEAVDDLAEESEEGLEVAASIAGRKTTGRRHTPGLPWVSQLTTECDPVTARDGIRTARYLLLLLRCHRYRFVRRRGGRLHRRARSPGSRCGRLRALLTEPIQTLHRLHVGQQVRVLRLLLYQARGDGVRGQR